MSRLARVLLIAVGTLSLGQSRAPIHSAHVDGGRLSRFNKSDRSVLAELRAEGQAVVVLDIASRPGQNAAVAHHLDRLGARIRFREDSIDYLSAVVSVARADEASWAPGVEEVSVDMGLFRPLEHITDLHEPNLTQGLRPRFASPGPDTPSDNPFLPTRDIGAPQFVANHPTFDGRGVTMAFIDGGIELLVPELQTATTLDGRPTRKIVDWFNPVDPLDALLPSIHAGRSLASLGYPFIDSTWIDMRDQVTAIGGDLAYLSVTYRVPSPGTYRIGLFDERSAGAFLTTPFPSPGHLAGDVNRDGNPPGSSGVFAVLWNERTNEVWVDTNQDHSFADERAMTDYAVRFDIGTFGTDDPSTPVRETVPFVVQTDSKAKFVGLGLTNGSHGTFVAGTAIGRGLFGGAFDGVAPGARGVSLLVDGNVYEHNLIESLIRASKHPATDVIVLTAAREARLDDDSIVLDLSVNRLVERYEKSIVVSALNSGPGLGTVGHPSVATNAISAGAYVGKETWLADFGAHVVDVDSVTTFSARGPRGDGALKPDVVAPAGGLSVAPAISDGENRWNTYPVPVGYRIGNGTSQSAPFAAGALALLLSGARQEGLPADPARLKLALANGARFLSGYGAHEQGSGLVQVGPAWEALQKLREQPPRIRIDGPVRTIESSRLQTPHRGPGLFEREGWSAGQRGTRAMTFTRTSGPDAPLAFALGWIGNDGTFQIGSEANLPLNVPVDVPLTMAPATSGVHSAILQILDRNRSLMIHQTAVTIVAAEEFTASAGYTISHTGQAPRPGSVSHFIRVPEQAPVLSVAVRVGSGSLQIVLRDPSGRVVDSDGAWPGYQPTGTEVRRAVEMPRAGVWEVIIDNSPDTTRVDRAFPNPLPPADYAMVARLLGTDVWRLDQSRSATVDIPMAFAASSRLAPFTGSLRGTSLGTARTERVTLTRARPQAVFEITAPAGAERLTADVGAISASSADVDLYLFDCTGKRCALRAHGTTAASSERVSVDAPTAGSWKIVVDAFALSGDATQIEYREVLLHPLYGHLEMTDASAPRPSGSAWRATAVPRIRARPEPERHLVGFIEAVGDDVDGSKGGSKGGAKSSSALCRVLVDVDTRTARAER